MNHRCAVSVVFAASALVAPGLGAQTVTPAPPRSAEALAEHYRQAHLRKDVDAITRLFYWGASTDKNRAAVTSFITRDVANGIRRVAVKPLDPKEPTQYTQGGVTYRMTLPATAKLVIDFLPRTEGGATYNSEQTSYFIGVWNGEYWLVTAEPARP
jgi:hypothetical protein